jgi:pyroglutamyl-peptidase
MPRPVQLAPLAAALAVAACAEGPGSVDDGPWILTEQLPEARVQFDFVAPLAADDVEGEVAWAIVDGALPAGLSLDSDGVIRGVAERSGVHSITVTAEDDAGVDEVDLELVVLPVVLISGFGPFAGYPVNPSIEALRELDEQVVAGLDVRVSELPVVWDEAWALLLADVQWLAPDVLIGTGVAGTDAMRYETTAVNEQWGTDVDGGARSGDEVVAGGPEYLYSDLPIEAMEESVVAAGHATTISGSAGTYLCNDIFYHVVHHAEYEAEHAMVAGFVHVPPLDGSFAVEDITAAHEVGLEVIADWLAGDRQLNAARVETTSEPVYAGVGTVD